MKYSEASNLCPNPLHPHRSQRFVHPTAPIAHRLLPLVRIIYVCMKYVEASKPPPPPSQRFTCAQTPSALPTLSALSPPLLVASNVRPNPTPLCEDIRPPPLPPLLAAFCLWFGFFQPQRPHRSHPVLSTPLLPLLTTFCLWIGLYESL